MSSATQTPAHFHPARPPRPATIAQLADRALFNLWDPSKGLKLWLKTADAFRKTGKAHADAGDLEAAFVEYAKAATIILEKLPSHKDYNTLLTSTQRQNLGLNGQNILDSLSELKPTLVDRYERWAAQHPEEVNRPPPSTSQPDTRRQEEDTRRAQQDAWQEQKARQDEDRRREDAWRRSEDSRRHSRARPESSRQPNQDAERRQRDDTRAEDYQRHRQVDPESRRRDETIAVARRAADVAQQETSYYRRIQHDASPMSTETATSSDENRRDQDARRQREDMKRREEEIIKQRRKREQEGILRRQEEADIAARAARVSITPAVPTISTSATSNPQRSAFLEPRPHDDASPLPMPLESPTRRQPDTTPTGPGRGPAYPAPVTTTSPPPPEGAVRYPQLMSQHQLKQGYAPSLQSMFSGPGLKPSSMAPSSLLFIPDSSPSSYSGRTTTSGNLYSSDTLPQPSAPVIPAPPVQYPYGAPHGQDRSMPAPPHPPPPPKGSYQGLSKTPQGLPPPPPLRQLEGDRYRTPSQESARIIRPQNPKAADPSRDLKAVNLPRECLQRFLSIAALNTSRNRETCGLLLGKDKGHKYVVTTLLIPKQHSTSDTCTMDEEELVLQFTEERALITLGWIHTHPSQSCFMSSVDLHTHSGFQRMLPESFAVVCAPKSTPNFGIFRLTDPPGLQTILDCNAKEAFHPHPEVPIYTDADKGHVQMRDMPLEIVDLR
ncbi:hypothetical protein SERLA73DRAFT_159766 [Serpula lacrymans var. lacrymans S7.3]|uniref:MPN domain-containing protein n=1 Tax=Serpula lacrymans var. lacrymans (strain S7.3) TaxID=936435 RepID=F8PSQ9_SERL3|nr:hypothetical protein SERLA73DRAFT_159766 [Serpula lacrymans var. lacrymans S7.3]